MFEYPEGWDFEWLAIDENDSIAVFTTGGEGPVPILCFSEYSDEKFSEVLWGLSKISGYELLVDLPRPDDYIELAKKGFYTFDWADVHRAHDKSEKYEIQSKPTMPIKLNDLPEFMSKVVSKIRIPVRFEEAYKIDVGRYVQCIYM